MIDHAPEALRMARELRFPAARALGWIDVRAWRSQEDDPWQGDQWRDRLRLDPAWRRLSEARGTVGVPAGMETRLRINTAAAASLSGLAALGPDDLQALVLAFQPVTNEQLDFLTGLIGLHTLNLWGTRVTPPALQRLQALQGLKHIAFSPAVIGAASFGMEGAGWLALTSLSQLETLFLNAKGISGAEIARFMALPRVRTLRLIGLDSLTTTELAQTPRPATLRVLGVPNGAIHDRDLEYISTLPNLEELDLSGTRLDGSGLGYLQRLARLARLSLRRTRIPEARLQQLTNMPQLEEIDYAENRFGEEGLIYLARVPSLRALNLSAYGTGVAPVITARAFHHLAQARQLRQLDLSEAEFDEDGVVYLSKLGELQELGLMYGNIGDASLEHVGKLSRLRVLNLWGTEVSDAGLARLEQLADLQELELAATQVRGPGLLHLRGSTRLRRLSLGGTHFESGGLGYLGELRSLEDLYLEGEAINDECAARLRDLARLRKLSLFFTKVTSAALSVLPHLTELRSLAIHNAPLTDAGLPYLAQLPNLEELDLGETQVSDAGLNVLEQLHELERLYLRNTSISREGLARLRAALPNCMISS